MTRRVAPFLAFLAAWTALNTWILGPRKEAFDPFPYIFLNLFLSMIAALQAPVIMLDWQALVAQQRRQIELLTQLVGRQSGQAREWNAANQCGSNVLTQLSPAGRS